MTTIEERVDQLLARLPDLSPELRKLLREELIQAIATDRAEINSEIQQMMGVLQIVREADLAKMRREVEAMLYPKP
jgi:flagellar biosynthesis/type III secretory pathway chaperone